MLQTAQRTAKSKKKKGATASVAESAADEAASPHERFLEAFRWMLLARTLEEKLVSLYRGGQITGGVYIGKGQEAISVASGLFLEKGDIFAPLIRDQAGRSAFGEPLVDVTRTYLGSRLGPMRGRDGNIHRGHPRDNELAMISHLGAMVSVTVGTLMAKRFRREKDFVGLTCIGEGGMQTGAFHEGMNIAAVEQVPLVVVATNNHYAYSTPNDREFACDDLMERAIGYGFEGSSLDGTDLTACLDVIGGAVKRARAGRPPQLVVASVLRLSGHGEHDDASYVSQEMKQQPFARDCLKVAEQTIIKCNLMDSETLGEWRKDAAAQVDEAVATAQKEAVPEADTEDWCALSTRDLVDHVDEE
ncbi:MAG: thiamine pyrophosphate-dependent dehydrogenase E1 component subunit alpha [Chthoniobacterales bacterium]